MKAHNKETQAQMTPRKALQFLQEGIDRFINNLKANRNLLEQVNETRNGQWPFATILSCIDSRTSAELIFDQGLGDVFSVRIAGNIVNTDILGSMEFACKVAGSKLIVVLGHSKCGAVKGACDHVEMGNLTELLSKIQPAVYEEKQTTSERNSKNSEFVENVSEILNFFNWVWIFQNLTFPWARGSKNCLFGFFDGSGDFPPFWRNFDFWVKNGPFGPGGGGA